MKKILLFVLSLSFVCVVHTQTLLIFGGDNHDVYLGCFNCNKFDNSSIWNKFGKYGSKFNSSSIWNKFGNYGGKFSNNSPFNKFATKPPVLLDSNGNFYGYLTANKYLGNRSTSDIAIFITNNWEIISEDTSKGYDAIFN